MASTPASTGPLAHWQAARLASQSGDRVAERAALALILANNRRDIAALLATGESFARDGDDRAAVSWFTTAINQAGVTPPPANLHALLDRAVRYCNEAQARFGAAMNAALADADIDTAGSPALRHAVEMLHGRADLYLQQPTMFYYPGLPQRAFYEREEFAWVAAIEAQAAAMRDELLALISTDQPFAPYVQRIEARPPSSSPLLDNPSWGAAYLWQGGMATMLAARCPATMAALALAPLPHIAGRSPMALYSRLTPGTHIAPHHGLLNTRLICHLPLIAPDGCGLRVGAETREWRFGEMLIFDDSFEHEAWNRGSEDRTILLFEIWRPEIPESDRALLARLFTAIDAADPARGQEQG
jgi:aspartyl/asparaginyl beta-hydroxylase (cupin superfamily)